MASGFQTAMTAETTFNGKIVVIAGDGRELGLVLARSYAEAGSRAVIVAAPGGERDAEIADALQRGGMKVETNIVFAELDVRVPAQSVALVEQLVEQFGELDIWINTSIVQPMGSAETLPPSDWEVSLTTILSGAFYCAQAIGRQMLRQGHGVIANLTSVAGVKAVEGRLAYGVAHAGLWALTQALGVEWAGRGVRVVGVALPLELGETSHRTPLRDAVTAEHVAEALLYLTSDEAAYVTAETLRLDGGWTAYQLF
jgi:NAD(P)-dependent dehydrogenase (short-subunit alcohol dehydrogenase family)